MQGNVRTTLRDEGQLAPFMAGKARLAMHTSPCRGALPHGPLAESRSCFQLLGRVSSLACRRLYAYARSRAVSPRLPSAVTLACPPKALSEAPCSFSRKGASRLIGAKAVESLPHIRATHRGIEGAAVVSQNALFKYIPPLGRITTAGVSKYLLYILCPTNPLTFTSSDNRGLPLPCLGGRDHILAKASVETCGADITLPGISLSCTGVREYWTRYVLQRISGYMWSL